ncbi:MAG: hypothetical protein FWC26_12945 [Fibromonadales bacterium]|nr:hypothetical protein [Fibromonadales bacterium]
MLCKLPKFWPILLLAFYVFAEKQASLGSMDAVAERMGAGSKELAKGNAAVADTSAFSAAYWNPGMLAFKRGLNIALHAEHRSLDRAGGSFGIEGNAGNRMGIGMAILFRGDTDFLLIDEDDNDMGTAAPFFMLGYAGLGYRLSKADGVGISLSIAYDRLGLGREWGVVDKYQSPLSFDLGWFRFWSAKWQSGLQIRNLGFNSKLSASWRRNPSRDNSLPSSDALRPKTFEAGVVHRNLLLGKPVSVSLSLLSYQVADTLFVFDPDWHIFKSRFGFEWRAIKNGDLRFGIDGKNPSIGWGYAFNIANKILWVDYAFIYEWEADLLNPLSLTLRMSF